jgi:tetratricopeptide (TPR) repeat protein
VEKQSLILNNKGAVLIHLQQLEDALGLFELAYKLRKERFGEENILTYNCLENIASVKCKLGLSPNESISDYERVFKFKERRYGVGSREAIRTKGNLCLVLLAAKRYKEGLENCHYCLEKLHTQSEGDDLAKFTKQFTQQMNELCRSDCTR